MLRRTKIRTRLRPGIFEGEPLFWREFFRKEQVAYSQDFIDRVLGYLDAGYSARDAEERFGISRES